MITFTFAGDEAGDVSLNFEKGASRYFVMAVIGTTQPDILRHTLDDVRQKSNLPPSYEFSFHTMTSTALRLRTFQALRTADFEAWALVVDKTQLPKSFRVMRRLDFYLLCITELIEAIPAEKREKATLILDEFGGEPRLPLEFRRFMKQRNIPRHFSRVLTKRSKSEPLIQAADLVAGAVLRRDTHHDSESFDIIQRKLRAILEFQP